MKRFLAAALVWSLSGVILCGQETPKPVKVADGVWAMQTGGGANAGWFQFGSGVVAVDAGRNASDAAEILSAIGQTAGKKSVTYLVVTNDFAPHAAGSVAIAQKGAAVICAEKIGGYMKGLLSEIVTKAPVPSAVSDRPVVMTVAERLILDDGLRHVEITAPGPGNSTGDLVVYLSTGGKKILFSGDLADNSVFPLLLSKSIDPDAWIQTLRRLASLKIDSLVPGVGPIGPIEGMKATDFYIEDAWAVAQKIAAEPTPENFIPTRLKEVDLKVTGLPPELEKRHETNITALVKKLREENPAPAPGQ